MIVGAKCIILNRMVNLGGTTGLRKRDSRPIVDGSFLFVQEEAMNQILVWVGSVSAITYGALTSFAGFGQTRQGKIQLWAAWGMIVCGGLVLGAGVMTLFASGASLWVLVVGLLGIHALAINNGLRMFGKITPSHHLVRLAISVVLIALNYLAMK